MKRLKLVFREPTGDSVRRILHNEFYDGELRFPRSVPDTMRDRNASGHYPRRAALPHETKIYRNHHEGYITPEQFERNRERLRDNAPTQEHRSFGDGSALLQRKVRCFCSPHKVLAVGYKHERVRDRGRCHSYHCTCGDKSGAHKWSWIPGNLLDQVVIDAAFEHYGVKYVGLVEGELQAFRSTLGTKIIEWRKELQHVTAKAEDLKDQFAAARGHPRLRERLAAASEEELIRMEALQKKIQNEPAELSILHEADLKELRGLLAEFKTLFWSSSATNGVRKRIIDCMVQAVHIEEKAPQYIRGRIEWKDGTADTPIEAAMFRAAYPIMVRRLREGAAYRAIAHDLNTMGHLNSRLERWTAFAVGAAARAMGLGCGRPRRH